jgi:hypothetical protein
MMPQNIIAFFNTIPSYKEPLQRQGYLAPHAT